MAYGITETGFNRKTAEDLQESLETSAKDKLGTDIKLTGDSFIGNILGIARDELSQIWELAEAVYFAPFRDYATGTNLEDAISTLGKSKLLQQKSTVTLRLTNSTGSPITVNSGNRFKQSSNNVEWETIEDVTIPASSTADVSATSLNYGAYTASIGSIDTIVNPVAGLSDVTNLDEAITGRDTETDAEVRRRVAESLVVALGGTGEAVANRLRNEVDGVSFVAWRENRTDDTDINGLLPHSVEFTIIGGADQDIADLIFIAKGDGIQTNGTEAINVVDDFGVNNVIKFNRADLIDIYYIVNLVTDSNYPSDGDDLVKAALVAYGELLENGNDVINWKGIASLNDIPGILDIELLQGIAPTPTLPDNIAIAENEKANILIDNITVNS